MKKYKKILFKNICTPYSKFVCTERICLKKQKNNDKLNAYLEYALPTAYLVEALFL